MEILQQQLLEEDYLGLASPLLLLPRVVCLQQDLRQPHLVVFLELALASSLECKRNQKRANLMSLMRVNNKPNSGKKFQNQVMLNFNRRMSKKKNRRFYIGGLIYNKLSPRASSVSNLSNSTNSPTMAKC